MSTTLITGANRGIGLALAKQALARGDTVVATAREPGRATHLKALGVEVHALDVTSEPSCAALAKTLAGRKIDLLIANAGVNMARGGLDDPAQIMADWTQLLSTNFTGVFFTVRALVPNVIAAKGKIGIISSRMGSSARAAGNAYAYRASKAAASNLAANLAVEMKAHGVAVASYHPGWVQTDMGGSGADLTPDTSARDLLARLEALTLATSGGFFDHTGEAIPF
jgi:NAD(P)-dependent dehydrogenase (short-subunit alcohol dehydrogenase family)